MANGYWRTLSWTEFCQWLSGKRVRDETDDQGTTSLDFEDGSQARLTSIMRPGTPAYSEYTPGSDGEIKPPKCEVWEER